MQYIIRDLGRGLGIFYKVNNEVMLKDQAVINLDNCFIFVNIDDEEVLSLKIFTESGNTSYDPM